jgi:hypothetical protein
MKLWTLLVCLFIIACAIPTLAQDPEAEGPVAPKQLAAFSTWTGTWIGEMEFIAEGETYLTADATFTIARVLDGFYYKGNWSLVSKKDAKTEDEFSQRGETFLSWDDEEEQISAYTFDNMTTSPYGGFGNFDDKGSLILQIDDEDGPFSREVWELASAKTLNYRQEDWDPEKKDWVLSRRCKYTQK